jgi:tRNA threonylcarbamoyl adenosine modification protein YeaZ
MILALETATNICSAAFEDNTGKQYEERIDSPGSHSEKLFLFIKKLMDDHQFAIDDLSAVLVSEGPGSYTGLRIAASGVKGLLFGSGVPLHEVSTLASFALAACRQKPPEAIIHAVIDGRRKHLYHQAFHFEGGVIKALNKVGIIPIHLFEKMIKRGEVITGTGLERIDENIRNGVHCIGKDFISARSLIQLYHRQEKNNFIQEVDPAAFDPNYFTSSQSELKIAIPEGMPSA